MQEAVGQTGAFPAVRKWRSHRAGMTLPEVWSRGKLALMIRLWQTCFGSRILECSFRGFKISGTETLIKGS